MQAAGCVTPNLVRRLGIKESGCNELLVLYEKRYDSCPTVRSDDHRLFNLLTSGVGGWTTHFPETQD
jgi:hypothetical protein